MSTVKNKEYLFTVNKFKEPSCIENQDACGLLLMRIIMMEPGTDPLHPDMGVGIRRYRYTIDNIEDLRKRIETQIKTYLPQYQDANVELVYNSSKKTVNVEITMDNVTFVYDSEKDPIPITLEDMSDMK